MRILLANRSFFPLWQFPLHSYITRVSFRNLSIKVQCNCESRFNERSPSLDLLSGQVQPVVYNCPRHSHLCWAVVASYSNSIVRSHPGQCMIMPYSYYPTSGPFPFSMLCRWWLPENLKLFFQALRESQLEHVDFELYLGR